VDPRADSIFVVTTGLKKLFACRMRCMDIEYAADDLPDGMEWNEVPLEEGANAILMSFLSPSNPDWLPFMNIHITQ